MNDLKGDCYDQNGCSLSSAIIAATAAAASAFSFRDIRSLSLISELFTAQFCASSFVIEELQLFLTTVCFSQQQRCG